MHATTRYDRETQAIGPRAEKESRSLRVSQKGVEWRERGPLSGRANGDIHMSKIQIMVQRD